MAVAGASQLAPLRCPRCGHEPARDLPENYLGCMNCRREFQIPVNYVAICEPVTADGLRRSRDESPEKGIWRWQRQLAVKSGHVSTLGEGNTPLILLRNVAAEFGASQLYVKNEAANPTS